MSIFILIFIYENFLLPNSELEIFTFEFSVSRTKIFKQTRTAWLVYIKMEFENWLGM